LTVRTLHSTTAVVAVVDVGLDVEGGLDAAVEPGVGSGVDVGPGVEVGLPSVVVVAAKAVVVVSNTDELVGAGAMATGSSPTWESARPTICHVSTVVKTSAVIQAAAIRQVIMG
jgi:hypothetical protein